MNIFMRFPEGKDKALTLSYDDGVWADKRFMEIINRGGLRCTFNINSKGFAQKDAEGPGRMSAKQCLELYTKSGYEVAVHAATHPFLEELPLPLAINEVLEDRKNLEKMFGTIVRGMAYPYGTYNDALVEGLKNVGIAYSRTTVSTGDFKIPTNWLRMPATCHHNNPQLMELCDKFLRKDRYVKPKLFYLWGHTYEFDNNNNWDVIEKFTEKMGDRDDIWYATNIEVYDYVEAYRRLIFSIETRKVYNPSAIPVWFTVWNWGSNKIIKVNSGETLEF